MTSDIVQNTHIAKNQAQEARGFLGSHTDLLGFFKKPDIESHETNVMNLLKTAYKRLKDAENQLALKEKRIHDLEKIMVVDELTNITNRRGFYKAFEGELDRTNRGINMGGLLIMIDLDHFKAINDTFGHQAGDEALRTVAAFLKSNVRPMDVAARLGGDEFILLMPNTSISQAMQRAKKIGNDLNNLTFEWNNETIHIHGSLGLKEYDVGDTIETIIEEADQGMYEAKEERKQAS